MSSYKACVLVGARRLDNLQTRIECKNALSLTVASLKAAFILFLFETPVTATLLLELNSALDDSPSPAMLDLAAFGSLILAAFSFWGSLSEASFFFLIKDPVHLCW